MKIPNFPFQTFNWDTIPKKQQNGETSIVFSQTFMMGDIRVRKVEYSAEYKADHWCSKSKQPY